MPVLRPASRTLAATFSLLPTRWNGKEKLTTRHFFRRRLRSASSHGCAIVCFPYPLSTYGDRAFQSPLHAVYRSGSWNSLPQHITSATPTYASLPVFTVPLQCLWRDSVTLISTLLLTSVVAWRHTSSNSVTGVITVPSKWLTVILDTLIALTYML